jgi:hypothetical protein
MDDSILAMFPDDDHVLGPFLGNLPPEILDAVVQKLGWFQTTFAMAGRTCREVVKRVPSTRAVLAEDELGQIEVRRRNPLAPLAPLAVAVVEGDVEALGWLIQLFDGKGLNWRADDFGSKLLPWLAIRRGKIDSLTCLRANGCPWDEHTCTIAARRGHLEVLQWLRQNGCPWSERTCSSAAERGDLEMLQWARQNGCPWDLETCWVAAEGGHLEVLQWLRHNGCPLNEGTCRAAATGGHLVVLQWAHQDECPWDRRTWNSARSRCRPYMIERGCPGAERRAR